VAGTVSIANMTSLRLNAAGVDFSEAYWQTDRQIRVLSASGLGGDYNSTDPMALVSNAAGNGYGNWDVSYDNQGILLNWNAVPEPSALLLMGLGASSLLLRRRRTANGAEA